MKQRFLLLTIDTISELLKDYVDNEEDIPSDAMPIKMMFKPTEQGKIGLVMVSDHFKDGAPPILVRFDIKRVFSGV